jgi:hypothetical protein
MLRARKKAKGSILGATHQPSMGTLTMISSMVRLMGNLYCQVKECSSGMTENAMKDRGSMV